MERLARALVVRRRLPAEFGHQPIYVTGAAGLKHLRLHLSAADPLLWDHVLEFIRTGAVVYDIGANLGMFSLPAAVRAGPTGLVVALEPDSAMAALLRRSASQGTDRAPIRVLTLAASESVGTDEFHVARRSRATSHLSGHGLPQTGGIRSTRSIATITLDRLLDDHPEPDIVKIDVEGAEARVLRGASRLLTDVRPVILCEVGNQNSDEVTEILTGSNYLILDGSLPLLRRKPESRAPWNTVAVPLESSSQHRNSPSSARRST